MFGSDEPLQKLCQQRPPTRFFRIPDIGGYHCKKQVKIDKTSGKLVVAKPKMRKSANITNQKNHPINSVPAIPIFKSKQLEDICSES
tara:strand:- start:173 stop:433 length:261 start_codon:yes stop_codon:yes gene_type:complete